MRAGTYYVGDLCYVMDAEWDEFCSLTINGNAVEDGEFNLADGRRFAFSRTAYGDGCYYDQAGNEYGVDAGLIGVIRVEDIREDQRDRVVQGNVIQFNKPFTVQLVGETIVIGETEIFTGFEEDDEDIY